MQRSTRSSSDFWVTVGVKFYSRIFVEAGVLKVEEQRVYTSNRHAHYYRTNCKITGNLPHPLILSNPFHVRLKLLIIPIRDLISSSRDQNSHTCSVAHVFLGVQHTSGWQFIKFSRLADSLKYRFQPLSCVSLERLVSSPWGSLNGSFATRDTQAEEDHDACMHIQLFKAQKKNQ